MANDQSITLSRRDRRKIQKLWIDNACAPGVQSEQLEILRSMSDPDLMRELEIMGEQRDIQEAARLLEMIRGTTAVKPPDNNIRAEKQS